MQEIPILAIPRQQFSVVLDSQRWGIRIYQATGCMAVDFTLNDVELINGVRAVADYQLLPYRYMAARGLGNFAFATGGNNTELPWWEDFGMSCKLIYASASELPA